MDLCHTSDHRPVSALFSIGLATACRSSAAEQVAAEDSVFKSFDIGRFCSRECGRFAYGRYSTCCTRCKGPDGPHAADCESKSRAKMDVIGMSALASTGGASSGYVSAAAASPAGEADSRVTRCTPPEPERRAD